MIEIVLGLGIITLVFYFLLSISFNISNTILRGRIYYQIAETLQNEIEKVRGMKYEDVGILNGWPPGKLPKEQIVSKSGLKILVKYYVRNIDDPRDGTVTSTPADTAPADYKLVELEGSCLNCSLPVKTQTLSTIVAPKNVEAITNNGSLFIKVINANGDPVALARVKVDYLDSPSFTVEDLTDNSGYLRLIDVPLGRNAYAIFTTKDGYSYDKTYPPGDPQNPNPILPHQTVEPGNLTNVTLQIDKLSNVNFKFVDKLCLSEPSILFEIKGSKLIGRNPDVLKTVISTTTDDQGQKRLSLEWDNYSFNLTDLRYIFGGSDIYLRPSFIINPGLNYNFQITFASSSPINLLVNVLDSNKNYLKNVIVRLIKGNSTLFKISGYEEIFNDDWSNNNYLEITSGIETELYPGEVRLKNFEGLYPTSTEWLISKTIDLGTSSIEYKNFVWSGTIPSGTSIKFQIAGNNDNLTWNFLGPDGTPNSYFETQDFSLDQFNGFRYLRYKVFLQTDDASITPSLDKITISYSSSCFPSGQVLFQNLSAGNYTLEVSKVGYQTSTQSLTLSNNEPYKEVEVILSSF